VLFTGGGSLSADELWVEKMFTTETQRAAKIQEEFLLF
jgi:hypothetical protein